MFPYLTSITHPLIHINQKKELAVKTASANGLYISLGLAPPQEENQKFKNVVQHVQLAMLLSKQRTVTCWLFLPTYWDCHGL
jgi:hypothetical protein